MQFQIETANWHDLGALRQLEQICFPKDAWPLWDLVGILTLPHVIRLKVMVGGQMVGFVAGDLHRKENLAWIATIGVLPDYRRQGIGRALMQTCEQMIGDIPIRLSVRVSNLEAIHLYESLGYRTIGSWIGYYDDGEDATVMEKGVAEAGII
jgi:ribosomal-protein-alanine N-acetyltransferase